MPDGRAANQPDAAITLSPPIGAPLPGAVVSAAVIGSPASSVAETCSGESLRQQRKATRAGGTFSDALNRLQVDEREDWTGERITERYAARAAKAVAGRRRTPGLVRRRTMPMSQDINGAPEPWTFGYLIDVILTRDPWMHRLDIARATGSAPHLTADHDGVIVADVVAEWAGRHGKDFELTLTGPAGGAWKAGAGGPGWTLDAIDFCRATSGRPASVTLGELMNTEVPY